MRHSIGYFGAVLPSQSFGVVLKKLNQTQQKQAMKMMQNYKQNEYPPYLINQCWYIN